MLADAFGRGSPGARRHRAWWWRIPVSRDRHGGVSGRWYTHQLQPTVLQRGVSEAGVPEAARRVGFTQKGGVRSVRPSVTTHLPASGYDIRAVQELLGHRDVGTNMLQTHVLNAGGLGVCRPLDVDRAEGRGRRLALLCDSRCCVALSAA